ncbi:MAG: hypothetical protein BroJett030_06140 [Alphaproteobacteria bacterium]|nr:MAG: hypothetical protein BroJett030_06140 [Alphaproteobacteria bacterium]
MKPTDAQLSEHEREVMALLQSALVRVTSDLPHRGRVAGHIEAALRCFHDRREGIPPEELNSANDG